MSEEQTKLGDPIEPTVSIVVPWFNCDPDRAAAWHWLRKWHRTNMPEAEIIECSPEDGEEFNKPTLVNRGVTKAQGEVVIIIDADVLPAETGILQAAVSHAVTAPWVVPHGVVLRLRQEPTDIILSLAPDAVQSVSRLPHGPLVRPPYTGIPGGGLIVIRRERFLAMGGFDPNFKGWGGEDSAFGLAADCLVGQHLRYSHVPLLHFWHDPGLRSVDPNYSLNTALLMGYKLAHSDISMMATLRGIPVPRQEFTIMSRPARQDSILEWLAYLAFLGVPVSKQHAGQKLALMFLAMENEWRRDIRLTAHAEQQIKYDAEWRRRNPLSSVKDA